MTTYYVGKQGSDSNNGQSPDASAAANKPWLTIGKALGSSGIASGDTVYIGTGTYREVVTVNMTSATAETKIIGDVANSQGFKDGSGVLIASGDVIWTAYLTTDTVAPSGTVLLNLNGRDFLTFQTIIMVGSGAAAPSIIGANTTNSVNITLRELTLLNSTVAQTIGYTGLADVASNWLIDRCLFLTFNNASISINLPTSTTADYDTNFVVQNCVFYQLGSNGVSVSASGANSFKAGGVDVWNCTLVTGSGNLLITNSSGLSTSIPCTAYDNMIIVGNGSTLNANTSGQIIGDFNRRFPSTTLTNVTAGVNDVAGNINAPLLEIGQAWLNGRSPRPFLMPMALSPLLGFGNQSGAPTVDFLNRARPSGGGSASTTAPDSGTATAGTGTTLVDALKSWTTNAFAGFVVKLTGGTGSGQQRIVQSNTGTTLTVDRAWSTTPDVTSTYTIDHPGRYAAVGYLERHDSMRVGSSLGADSGGYGEIVGPGDHDFVVAVDPVSTTISIGVKWDSNHGDTNKPQAKIINGNEVGVSDQTVTATGSAGSAYETLTFSAFTPTAVGIVTLRLISRAINGNGIVAWDTFS